jgi:tetratricopeptide (TPR) repeat protein
MGRTLLLAALIAALTLAVYSQVTDFDFVRFDDPRYVTENPQVRAGLSFEGARWAFTTRSFVSWQPLTWLSHMLDVELFGLDPGSHHAVNLGLHVLNALLLFGLLRSLSGDPWPSALVAALFALHPLHVESVAWVSERKDVLSTALGLLATAAWVGWTRHGGAARYAAAIALLALGLLAKSMLVTLPCVWLLLDHWPLRRRDRGWRRLCLEKLPAFALSAAVSTITFAVQQSGGAMRSAEQLAPGSGRLANALVSAVGYLRRTLWPEGLSVLVPHPGIPGLGGEPLTTAQVIGAAALLGVASALAAACARRRPYVAVGWLWYLGMLVPVIGLVQVGSQAMADRYTYLPLVGIFLIAAFGGADLARGAGRPRRTALGAGALAAVLACAVVSHGQARVWRDSESLFEHALAVNPDNVTIRNNLGNLRLAEGRVEEAIEQYRRVVRSMPDYAVAHDNLGNALASLGRVDEAIHHYREALRARPDSVHWELELGQLLVTRGELAEARRRFERALELDAGSASAWHALGHLSRLEGDVPAALAHYRGALERAPDLAAAHADLAALLLTQGELDAAIHHYREAVGGEPGSPERHTLLAHALRLRGDLDQAVEHYRRALLIQPGDVQARRNLLEAMELRRSGHGGA